MAPHRLVQHSPFLSSLLARLLDTPAGGWIAAAAASLAAAAGHDPFTLAWGLLILFSVFDYVAGVSLARGTPAYSAERKVRGRRDKILTVALILGLRLLEGVVTHLGMLNLAGLLAWVGLEQVSRSPVIQQGGIISAVLALFLAVGELRSVYAHRIANGGSSILFLEVLFGAIRAGERALLGKVARKVQTWEAGDPAEIFTANLTAVKVMDDAIHAATHDGVPAPSRRHTDAAVAELSGEEEKTK